ncbi:MAG: PepSY domain-containing protein [Pseudomonas sp.]|uniref:PepSY-associated TM helix domain-containing protein n=1 Tax=Ectopseudomonas guguanensis TaxID=1198456 RepID=UPI0012D66904|nr:MULTISPECIES: PepSY-associated TM helix domain-containing protein [Pseudomonas]MPT16548.1 PepSY domain-containing protein [Pseudomonas sp.]WJH56658.1 PepSY domain-containing protein [Pseudomonas guguanensis]
MKPLAFRQANAWLHTWTGLLLGWLLYAIFLTGTLSFFQEEISYWMKPELHTAGPRDDSARLALAQLEKHAPDAAQWNVSLPGPRNAALQIQWFEPGERIGKGGGQRLTLDTSSGEPVQVRETRGGSFLYRFHFELYAMPREVARWIVGIATMLMLVAIVSGVITHKKIFKDFFTFRPAKGQRSWLDAHNVTAVLALPFHFMITYSGLLLLMFMLMPWGVESAYQGDRQAFFSEAGGRGGGGRGAPTDAPRQPVKPAQMTDLAPLLAHAQQRWPQGIASLSISAPNTERAVVELRQRGGDSLLERGNGERLRFNGVTGAAMNAPKATPTPAASAVYNVFTSLHLIRFAGPPLRWMFFLSGLLGTAMIATGLVLWVVKRLPERKKLSGTPFGHRLVEMLNVGCIAGLPVAIAAYFWANRLLPAGLEQRADWEIRGFFIAWALCLLHPLLRSHKRAWLEQTSLAALLFGGLPFFALLQPSSSLITTVSQGHWLLAGMDLALLASAALLALATWHIARHQAMPSKVRQTRKVTQEAAA